MELTILGVNSPYPRNGRATLGYLVRQGETRLLLDSGCGVHRRLSEAGLLGMVDGVVQSHLHYDHCADLPAVVLGATIGQGKSGPLPIHLPPGEGRRLHEWLTACGFTFISAYMTVVEPAYHETVNLGELAFTISPAQHSLPAAILTLTAGGKRLVYTGDTGDCPPLWKAMEGADLVLAEVAGLPPAQAAEKGHLPAALLGRMARAAGVRELVLTHFMHGSDPEALAEEVAAAFGRPVHLAHEDRIFEV